MNKKRLVIIFTISILLSCTKKDVREIPDPMARNISPIARAGQDQTINFPVTSVTLDGRSSKDPNGNIGSYLWRTINGCTSCTIQDSTEAKTQISGLTIGFFLFELKVTDTEGLSAKDTVQVTVNGFSSDPGFFNCTWVCLNFNGLQSIRNTSTEIYQAYGASASLDGKAYFGGGHDDSYYYPGSWGSLPWGFEYDPLLNKRRYFTLSLARSHLAGAAAGSKILFAGGDDLKYYGGNEYYDAVDIIDQTSLTVEAAHLSEARSYLAAVSIGSKAYFIGGKTTNGFSSKIDVYDAVTSSWALLTLPRERGYCGAAVIENRIYIAGGKNSTGDLRIVDIYDITTDSWSFIESPNVHPNPSVISLDRKLFIAGGDGLNNKSVDIFDLTTNQFTSASLLDSRFDIAVAAANNKVIFAGGTFTSSPVTYSTSVEVYDNNSGSWQTGSFKPAVAGIVAGSANGKIMLHGFLFDGSLAGGTGPAITNEMIVISP